MAIDDVDPPEGPVGPVGDPNETVTLHKAFYNLMVRIGFYGTDSVKQAAKHLDAVDTATGMSSKRLPPT